MNKQELAHRINVLQRAERHRSTQLWRGMTALERHEHRKMLLNAAQQYKTRHNEGPIVQVKDHPELLWRRVHYDR